ncbi:hypothetical protein [Candidatus Tokpelaia sp.]|uniref:hypothetical protein n=1 Tax=Candidatus Tokpelaia sp. TaxID=2233777 RepID=UPI0012392D38|nr:hypothetical protein [Candidatus Tokpelaia sp.]KAA6406117.1 hypothetical protein DPQ22_01410 [Candidatus Tokpelaia sp.]
MLRRIIAIVVLQLTQKLPALFGTSLLLRLWKQLLLPQRQRANLLKRKAQARQRKAAESEGSA